MIRKSGAQFLIESVYVSKILENLENAKTLEKEPIMINALVKRVVCEPENTSKAPRKWVRIMEGDIDHEGDTQRCSMTFIKKENGNNKKKDTLMLKVDNFDDALHFVNELGFVQKSYQENLRSKFHIKYRGAVFSLRFDAWPEIQKYIIIEIDLLSSREHAFMDIIDALKIKNYLLKINTDTSTIGPWAEEEGNINLNAGTSIDIDDLYKISIGKAATEMSNITFELGLFDEKFKNYTMGK